MGALEGDISGNSYDEEVETTSAVESETVLHHLKRR